MSPLLLAFLATEGGAAAAGLGDWGALFYPEDKQRLEWHCSDVSIVSGSVPYAVAVDARRSYARTYSAINELEREILPALARQDSRGGGNVFRIGVNALLNVTQLPSIACGELARQKYDVGSYNLAFGAGNNRFSLFYSASANYALVSKDGIERTIKHGGGFILGHFYSFSAPLWGARAINADDIGGDAFTDDWAFMSSGDGAIGGVSLDYIAGASLDLDYAYFGAGYVGSKGLYFHSSQPQSRLFFDTVADLRDTDGLDREDFLRYLKTGVAGFRWLADEYSDDWQRFGATDADLTRYRIVTPSGEVVTAADSRTASLSPPPEETLSMTALRQRDIRGILDVAARYQVRPTPQLYEGTVRLHTRGYHPDLVRKYAGKYKVDGDGAASVAVGLVNLPERTYFGVRGGPRPYISADVIGYFDDGDVNGGNVKAWIRLNDPDTLIIFPYAQGAWEVHLSASMSL